jgi:hypothetical protein
MRMSRLLNTLPIDSNRIAQLIAFDEIDPAVEGFASWSRVIAGAPIENKPALFGMMARDAAAWADAIRQQAIADMRLVASEMGLVDLIGVVAVQDTLMVAFDWGAA